MPWFRRRAPSGPLPETEHEEAGLIERVRDGDTAAFDALARRYERLAFSVAYRILRQREDAEDLVQDAFLTAIARIDTFRAGSAFRPWFLRILVNRGFNMIASRRVRRTDLLTEESIAGEDSPPRDAALAELRARTDAAIAGLSDRQRLVIELYELEGFSSPEIAAMLGIADSTVRWTLREARTRLREALAPVKREWSER